MSAKHKIRYSDTELHEFEALIHRKIQDTKESLGQLMDSLQSSNDQTMGSSSYDVSDDEEHYGFNERSSTAQ